MLYMYYKRENRIEVFHFSFLLLNDNKREKVKKFLDLKCLLGFIYCNSNYYYGSVIPVTYVPQLKTELAFYM